MAECLVCKEDHYRLGSHVQTHGYSIKEYYDKYLKFDVEHLCNNPECENEVEFVSMSFGYRGCCSYKCSTAVRESSESFQELRRENSRTQMIKQWENPEWIELVSESARLELLRRWSDPEYIALRSIQASESAKNQWENLEFQKLMSISLSERWKNPEFRDMMVELKRTEMLDNWQSGKITGHGSHKGFYFSERFKKDFSYRSSWELEAYELLDLNTELVEYEVEPIRITYEEVHTYIPDILIHYPDHKILVEIKPEKFIQDNIEKFHAAVKYCDENNIDRFEVWTENNWPNGITNYSPDYIDKYLS